MILLKIVTFSIAAILHAQTRQEPTSADILPAPPAGMPPLPLDEWGVMDGKMVQLTPEFAAKRREKVTQVFWLRVIGSALTVVLLFIATVFLLRIHRSRRWRNSGLCAACGYDLHGISELDPCPECGCSRTAEIT